MKVFASNYLESMSTDQVVSPSLWNWKPFNTDINKIYASGGKTSTRASTYASERDSNEDTDRPNEGA